MSDLIEINAKSLSPKAFSIDVEAVKKTVATYSLMTVNGIDDKNGLKAVRDARLELRRIRISIEKRGKELRADSTAFSKRVIEIEKEVTALVAPTEDILAAREDAIEKEIAAIANAKLDARLTKLAAVECDYPRGAVESMSDSMFESFLATKAADHQEKIEAARIVAEESERKRVEAEAARKAEESRMKAEREALEIERAALVEAKKLQDMQAAEQQAKIDEARRKLESEQFEQRRQQEIERAKHEAIEAERQRAEAEIMEQARQADARVAERLRVEALKPDREKLLAILERIETCIINAPASTNAGRIAWATIKDCISESLIQSRMIVAKM